MRIYLLEGGEQLLLYTVREWRVWLAVLLMMVVFPFTEMARKFGMVKTRGTTEKEYLKSSF